MSSFATFVASSREKKKNEALAQEFLGRGRKASAPGAGLARSQRNTSEKPTLLSRISTSGVQKQRSASAKPALPTNIDGKWQHDLHKLNNPNGPPAAGRRPGRATPTQVNRNERTYDKFASNLSRSMGSNDAPGFSIRGVAKSGPYTVIASNFAPGTTAADIEAVMTPAGGETLGCRLISASPTVMVELQFVSKEGAENVIATFNNQKADGRLLYVYMKDTPASNASAHSRPPPARLMQTQDDMDIDTNGSRAQGGSFQDGRFGFSEGGHRDPPRGPRRRY